MIFKKQIGIITVLSALISTSCLNDFDNIKPDEKMPLKVVYGKHGQITSSIYDYQVYYNIEKDSAMLVLANKDWDISFPTSPKSPIIRMNTSLNQVICRAGITPISDVNSIPSNAQWLYDASTGSTDSLGVDGWLKTETNELSGMNYILAFNEGEKIIPQLVFTITRFTQDYFSIKFRMWNSPDVQNDTIFTSSKSERLLYSFFTKKVIPDPENDDWHLWYGRYTATLETEGKMVPYPVNGTMINPRKIAVSKYYIDKKKFPESDDVEAAFSNLSINDFDLSKLNTVNDYIGWDWKTVNIETASYTVDTRMVYLFKTSSKYFKFRYTGYYLDNEKGFPEYSFLAAY